ncbi:hypothetical protein P9743_01380 [Anoxybacillus geothermalis]|nr:hypothetical protein [Anoxybacillus geothermalis]
MSTELLQTYPVPLLRNFEVQYLKPLLQNYIPNFNKIFNETPGTNSWVKISSILDQKIREGFDDSDLEKELFEKLVFELPDHVYLLPLETEIDANEFMERYSGLPVVNRKISSILYTEEKLITVRKFENKIIFLYRYGTTNVGDIKASLYVPCIIDFDNNFVFIKTRMHYVKKSETSIQSIIEDIINETNSQLDFELSVSTFNPSYLHEALYKLFRDESIKAEKIIKENMDDLTETELEKKINTFLKEELKIKEPDNYTDRVKSAFYQDRSLQMDNNQFYDGFIFAFTFFDREFTRSSTRSSQREPIYNKKIYWNLKDLIHNYQELTDISLYWKFDKNDFTKTPEGEDFSFVEVSFREKNGSLEIHFYNSKSDRRVKEEYVIYKIKDYIWPKDIS